MNIIRGADFMRLNGHGSLDLEASRDALKKLAAECVRRRVDGAMLDVRDVYGTLTVGDVYRLSTGFADPGFSRTCKLVILHRFSAREKADFFALCAANRGWKVRAYDNFEEAFAWLSTAEPLAEGCPAGEAEDSP